MLKPIRFFSYFLLTLFLAACSQDESKEQDVSQAAPTEQTAMMTDLDGKQRALSEFVGKGKWAVVNVWATDCPFCRDELFDLNNFHEKHIEQDAMVIGLTLNLDDFSMPDRDVVAAFQDDYFIDYPVMLVDQALAEAMIGKPVEIVPLTFFYNPEGKLTYQLKGLITEEILEAVIHRKDSEYKEVWAKQVPPVYEHLIEPDDAATK